MAGAATGGVWGGWKNGRTCTLGEEGTKKKSFAKYRQKPTRAAHGAPKKEIIG
jgi:hypothetical protein